MAENKSIGVSSAVWQAQTVYEETLLELVELVKSYEQLVDVMNDQAGGFQETPSWLWTLQRHLARFERASEGFLAALHEDRRPVLLIAG